MEQQCSHFIVVTVSVTSTSVVVLPGCEPDPVAEITTRNNNMLKTLFWAMCWYSHVVVVMGAVILLASVVVFPVGGSSPVAEGN